MNSLKKNIYIRTISRLISKACPAKIPRSGSKGREVNCFVVMLYIDKSPFILVENINEVALSGKAWDGSSFCLEASVPLNWLNRLTFRIEHYYGLATITYDSLNDFILKKYTGYYYIKHWLNREYDSVRQVLYNKKQLVLPERFKLLSLIVARRLNENKIVESFSMMTYLHGSQWILHPKASAARKRLDLYLSSFAESGELNCIQGTLDYEVTGKAIATLDAYELSQKRHKDAQRTQKLLVILTTVIAILTAIQSGVIKIPTLIDFNDQSKILGNKQK